MVCKKINTTGATIGAGTAYPSGTRFSGVGVAVSLDFCIVFSRSLDVPSVLFPLAIILGIDPVVRH